MIIQLGDITFRLVILLIYPAGIIPARITSYYYKRNHYFYLFIFFISYFLILFFILYYKIKDKCTSNKIKNNLNEDKTKNKLDNLPNIENDSNIKLIIKKKKTIDRKKQILSILFIGILYFIS